MSIVFYENKLKNYIIDVLGSINENSNYIFPFKYSD